MTKEAKEWLKKNKLLIKDTEYIDTSIGSKGHYEKLYGPSNGSLSGDGFCLFYFNGRRNKLYKFPEEVEKEVFHIDNMPVGI